MNLVESYTGSDNVYYNIRISNNEDRNIARFSAERVQPILENPSHYELTVARFTVPASKLPIMFFQNGNAADGYGVNEKYTVTMSYDGVDITETLQHKQTEFPSSLYGKPTVWSYQDFLDVLNESLVNVFTALKLAKPLAPPTAPPFMVYRNSLETFEFYAPEEYNSNTSTIQVYFNKELARLFDTFQNIYHGDNSTEKRWEYLFKDTYTNSTLYNGQPYYIMYQDSSTLYLWNEIQSIQFETSSIPVNPEFMATQRNVIRQVLTDFEPESTSPSRQVIQFYPQGELRYYDLNSSYPLKRIDLNVSWTDRKGNAQPVYVSDEDPLTVKLKFRKKKFTSIR
jgi:hypothetical protein